MNTSIASAAGKSSGLKALKSTFPVIVFRAKFENEKTIIAMIANIIHCCMLIRTAARFN